MSQDQVINAWFVKLLIIMADYKKAAMKSMNTPKMFYWICCA